jgi:predicted DCC family thiol-disulfide oxidoreductase YuxK
MSQGGDIVLYDGVCGLCNGVTRFILRRDAARRFRFASLQSDFARSALARYGRDPRDVDTIYVIVDHEGPAERLLAKSSAILYVLRRIGGPWRLADLLRVLPPRVLDRGYDRFIRHRYRIFGRLDACPLPRPEDAARFIEV